MIYFLYKIRGTVEAKISKYIYEILYSNGKQQPTYREDIITDENDAGSIIQVRLFSFYNCYLSMLSTNYYKLLVQYILLLFCTNVFECQFDEIAVEHAQNPYTITKTNFFNS